MFARQKFWDTIAVIGFIILVSAQSYSLFFSPEDNSSHSLDYFLIISSIVNAMLYFSLMIWRFYLVYYYKSLNLVSAFLVNALLYSYIVSFSLIYKSVGLKETDVAKVVHDGFIAFYFSCVTITTLGYGDFIPTRGITRLAAAIEALSGYVLLAFAISILPIALKALIEKKISN